jgi:hypothetical protein
MSDKPYSKRSQQLAEMLRQNAIKNLRRQRAADENALEQAVLAAGERVYALDDVDLSDPLVVQAIRDDATRVTRAEQAARRKANK